MNPLQHFLRSDYFGFTSNLILCLFCRVSNRRRNQQKQGKLPFQSNFKVPSVTYKQDKESDSLNFDSNFPWEDASLVKYDSFRSAFKGSRESNEEALGSIQSTTEDGAIDEAFKSGEFLGWEPVRRQDNSLDITLENNEPVTKTLCFCCEDSESPFLNRDFSHRKKRTVKIQDVHQSQQVLQHKEYIHDSLTCQDQDPIEVILVFGPENTEISTTESPLRIPPQLAESLYQNYDPVKIQLHESSRFRKRYSILNSKAEEPVAQNRLLNNENNVETVDAVQLESKTSSSSEETTTAFKPSESSEPSRPSSLLKEPSKPLVNTLPGYNILRLLTGG